MTVKRRLAMEQFEIRIENNNLVSDIENEREAMEEVVVATAVDEDDNYAN